MGDNAIQAQERKICGAKTRKGHPCKTRPVISRKRCRMHGGTNNGAPKGSQNNLKHGYYSKASIAARSKTHKLIKEYRKLCKELDQV